MYVYQYNVLLKQKNHTSACAAEIFVGWMTYPKQKNVLIGTFTGII